ncbi:nectin-4 isoform X2 [Parambassis ranga]|uniref:Nectin-4 isoform X2 n=1 Tax=Parambassis ranga TaxID=210632 RepID=A0A6P7K1F1_9TELE|nr:nectin-4-like isoform X2 [Parambassis ranga]
MESKGKLCVVLALLFLIAVSVQADFLEPLQTRTSQRSFAESQTRLPCQYQEEEGEKVVQVTWYKELPDGTKDQIITAHFTDGHTEFGRYSGRMRFENGSPTQNSALLIPNTEESDDGTYTCHISTFPNGNFERHITLTVWVFPISTLDPVILVEGQPFGVVASCRAVGRPAPTLSWDTDLSGQIQDRSSEAGSVSSYYSLHPLRSMNEKKLDCLMSHPGLEQPRRITNRLVVHYPPDATISTPSGHWYNGLEKAELVCEGGGNPKSENISWTWKGGALPDGVSVHGGKLSFGRALRINDSGVYECLARNSVGVGRSEYLLNVAEKRKGVLPGADNVLLIIIGASAGALVMVLVIVVLLVNRYHRHRTKKLEMQLNEKTEEVNSLSRQASFRRLNSVSSDPRVQLEDYALLRVDSRIKNSQMSLERPIYKGSQSTLTGKWEVDELGRPVLWSSGRESLRGAEIQKEEEEERRRRVEAFVKSSNLSLDSGLPSSLVPLKAQQEDDTSPKELHQGPPREEDSPLEADWAPSQSATECHEDDEDSSVHEISEALTNHFYFRDGLLRPRPHSNAILLHPRGQIV